MELNQGIKLVVFDFDGTLFDLDIDWGKLTKVIGAPAGSSLGEVIQKYNKQKHPKLDMVTQAEVDAARKKNLRPSAVTTLKYLLGNGYHVAIFSRNSREAIFTAFKGFGLMDKIYVVGREDVVNLKPHTEGLDKILRQFDCAAKQAVLVGDTYHDAEAASSKGMHSVIVRNTRLDFRPEGAEIYIESLKEIKSVL
jgi:HAD superfamily hydrolase (TIGR01509 family)